MKKSLQIFLLLIINYSLLISNCSSQWVQQPIPTGQLVQDMHFVDTMHGWLACSNGAVSDSGIVLYTSNGGTSWVKQIGISSAPLYAIKMANLNTGYCVGGFEKIYKTTNAGANWVNINTGFANYLDDIAVPNTSGDTAYIIDKTSGEGIWKTTNAGATFTDIYPSTYGQTLFFINNQTGWAEVGGFNLVRTTNGGVNWTTIYSSGNTITKIFFIDANTGWMFNAGFYKSTDGGNNWFSQTLPAGSSGGEIQMITPTYGYIGGNFNKMNKTVDGTNWTILNIPVFNGTQLSFVDSLTGWCGGGSSVVAKTTNGGVTYVEQISSELPKSYLLSQNYPNPFNPVTVIQYQLRVNGYTRMSVYNMLGNEVAILVNQKQAAGTYRTDFNGENLPSGTYFYRLTVNGITIDTKKMVLVK